MTVSSPHFIPFLKKGLPKFSDDLWCFVYAEDELVLSIDLASDETQYCCAVSARDEEKTQ